MNNFGTNQEQKRNNLGTKKKQVKGAVKKRDPSVYSNEEGVKPHCKKGTLIHSYTNKRWDQNTNTLITLALTVAYHIRARGYSTQIHYRLAVIKKDEFVVM